MLTLKPCVRYISIEETEVLSVATEEFIDAFHHGEEEKVDTLEQLRVGIHVIQNIFTSSLLNTIL
jgi:hypothetical protein